MDFAPYQDHNPEQTRALSPPPAPGRRSLSNGRGARSPPPPQHSRGASAVDATLPPPSHFGGDGYQNDGGESGYGYGPMAEAGDGGGGYASGRAGIDLFETSLPVRMDFEAMAAYLLLPPAGGVLLLVLEHKSDYVR